MTPNLVLGNQCRDLFDADPARIYSLPELVNDESFGSPAERIAYYVKQEKERLSPEEIDNARALSQLIEAAALTGTALLRGTGQLSGSEKPRVEIEESSKARAMGISLKGSSDPASEIRKIQSGYAKFEVNFLYALELETRIQNIRNDLKSAIDSKAKRQLWVRLGLNKILLANAQNYIGFTYFRYLAQNRMLFKLMNAPIAKHSERGKHGSAILENLTRELAAKKLVHYKPVSIDEVKRYIHVTSITNAMLHTRAALEELWMVVKLVTLSKPITDLGRKATRTSGALWDRSNSQHLRDTYLGDIETLLDFSSSVEEQYAALKSLNARTSTPKKQDGLISKVVPESMKQVDDEFLVTFARVPENMHIWLDLKNHAKSVSKKNAFDLDFYSRMEAAEKKAVELREYALYHQEAGATVFVKTASASFLAYMGGMKFVDSNPQIVDSFIDSILLLGRTFGMN